MALHQSKIYRALSGDARALEALCIEMEAGRSARELIAWVQARCGAEQATAGTDQLTDQNITDFRQGYYARWLERRAALAAVRERAALGSRLARESQLQGIGIAEAGEALAAAVLAEALESLSPEQLSAMMAEKPGEALRLIQQLSQLSRNETARTALAIQTRKLEEEIATLRQRREQEAAELRRKLSELQKALAAKQANPETLAAPVAELAALIERMVANG